MNQDYQARFGGIQRLYGQEGLERLCRAHVCVVGLGGVGSWAVEALARTGLGELTLVDLDDVCISNVNRQVPALSGNFGRPKVEVMAERVQAINPASTVHPVRAFFSPKTAESILESGFDYVFDAIDQVNHKCLLIARCKALEIPVLTAGGSGGRRDPAAVEVGDLGRATHDRLLQKVRKTLRTEHRFPKGAHQKFGVDCIYSAEPQVFPRSDGTVCAEPEPGGNLRLDCRSGYGTASFVTGTFGFVAAAHITGQLSGSPEKPPGSPQRAS